MSGAKGEEGMRKGKNNFIQHIIAQPHGPLHPPQLCGWAARSVQGLILFSTGPRVRSATSVS